MNEKVNINDFMFIAIDKLNEKEKITSMVNELI